MAQSKAHGKVFVGASDEPARLFFGVHPSSEVSLQPTLRRTSTDSYNAPKVLLDLNKGHLDLMPAGIRRFLRWSGGAHGSEPLLIKVLIIFYCLVATLAPVVATWSYGMPILDVTILYIFLLPVWSGSYIVRWQMLQSGLIWSLIDQEQHKKIVEQLSKELCALHLVLPLEGVVLSGACAIAGFLYDVGSRVKAHGETCRILGVGFMIVNVPLHIFGHATIKLLPILMKFICNILVADLQHFHQNVEHCASAISSSQPSSDDLEPQFLINLHQNEFMLRTRFAAANKTIEPILGFVVGSQFGIVFLSLIMVVRSTKHNLHAVNIAIWSYVALQYGCLLVGILRGMACVGDRWHQVLDDFNTPLICSRSAAVLGGTSLSERLGQLRSMGIVLGGNIITSSTVSSVFFTLASGLFLTLWTVLTD